MKTKLTVLIAGLLLTTIAAFAQNVEFDKENFKEDKDGLKAAKDNIPGYILKEVRKEIEDDRS